ncbi:hypothetical protein OAN61_00855 [bacterium]|nr:hypothetical protein [bacterium]
MLQLLSRFTIVPAQEIDSLRVAIDESNRNAMLLEQALMRAGVDPTVVLAKLQSGDADSTVRDCPAQGFRRPCSSLSRYRLALPPPPVTTACR